MAEITQDTLIAEKVLICPACRDTEHLATLEEISAMSDCLEITSKGPRFSGYTDVLYETSKTVGVACACGWEYEGDDWMKQLAES